MEDLCWNAHFLESQYTSRLGKEIIRHSTNNGLSFCTVVFKNTDNILELLGDTINPNKQCSRTNVLINLRVIVVLAILKKTLFVLILKLNNEAKSTTWLIYQLDFIKLGIYLSLANITITIRDKLKKLNTALHRPEITHLFLT